jgi:type IV pilus assembly protein PilE
MTKTENGFSLIELMVTVAIVGVLAMIAIPSYRTYVLRATRAEAKQALLARASDLERCYTRNNTYVNAPTTPCGVVLPDNSGTHYAISADTLAASTFVLKAVPAGSQVADTRCATFKLDDKNSRSVTGPAGATECWGR